MGLRTGLDSFWKFGNQKFSIKAGVGDIKVVKITQRSFWLEREVQNKNTGEKNKYINKKQINWGQQRKQKTCLVKIEGILEKVVLL